MALMPGCHQHHCLPRSLEEMKSQSLQYDFEPCPTSIEPGKLCSDLCQQRRVQLGQGIDFLHLHFRMFILNSALYARDVEVHKGRVFALYHEEIQNVYHNAPREFSFYILEKKPFKVNTTIDIDIHFIVNWDLPAAYCHFIFQFIKKKKNRCSHHQASGPLSSIQITKGELHV